MFDRHFQCATQFRSLGFTGDERPLREPAAERSGDGGMSGRLDELPTVDQIATQNNMRHAQSTDHVRHSDSQMSAYAVECHLRSTFTGVCASHDVSES